MQKDSIHLSDMTRCYAILHTYGNYVCVLWRKHSQKCTPKTSSFTHTGRIIINAGHNANHIHNQQHAHETSSIMHKGHISNAHNITSLMRTGNIVSNAHETHHQ